MRRARRAGAIAAEIEDLVEAYGVPVPTAAVRVLLADRDRPTTAEHLARVAASERAEHVRTRLPPRLCSAIAPDGALVTPRWWASGRWALRRRILTDDARPLWQAKLVEQTCSDLIGRRRPASDALATMIHGTVARLDLADELEGLPDRSDWSEIRALVLDVYPAVLVAHDVATDQQEDAERALLAADLPAVDRSFGISPHRARH